MSWTKKHTLPCSKVWLLIQIQTSRWDFLVAWSISQPIFAGACRHSQWDGASSLLRLQTINLIFTSVFFHNWPRNYKTAKYNLHLGPTAKVLAITGAFCSLMFAKDISQPLQPPQTAVTSGRKNISVGLTTSVTAFQRNCSFVDTWGSLSAMRINTCLVKISEKSIFKNILL